ncbi:chitinase-3-like protein 1 [Anarrhichthys ocellatus]|uniref:chitinase-3-like protein 1 n=1 Tax=Anarrhichthys ocellatus TaxID=433405 RepID=UPI0012EEA921|nr:chitinase-3-like protein 1 [Anarrhichthys ocellatus]
MCKLTLITGSSSRLVCYYNSEAGNREGDGKFSISEIDPNKCTHLIYAFSDINNQNELVHSNAADLQHYQAFNELKTSNTQLKTLLAVGGLTFNTQKFSTMVAEQQNRERFIQSAIKLLRANGFDGLNLDWRYPGGPGSQPMDKRRFTLLCKELKEAFVAEATAPNRDRLIVTASVSAVKEIIDDSYEVAQIATHLDFINVLTFDFHGPWESVTGHHSPLYNGSQDTGDEIYLNTDYAMRYWRDQGAPAHKLNLGLAAYGRAFDLSTASSDVGAPANGPGEEGCYTGEEGFWASYETCLYIEGNTTQLIVDQEVPYAVTENQWVGFDNKASLNTKVNYLKTNHFGGAFVWSLDLDDTTGQFCKMGKCPFISHLHDILVPEIFAAMLSNYHFNSPSQNNANNHINSLYNDHNNSTYHNYNNADYHNSSYNNHNNSPYRNYNNADYHNSPYHNYNSLYHNNANYHISSLYNDHHNSPYYNYNNTDYHNSPYHNYNNADYHNSPYNDHNSTYQNYNNSPYHNYNNADYHNSPFHNYNSLYHNNANYHIKSLYNDHNNSPYYNYNNADYHNSPYHNYNSLYHNLSSATCMISWFQPQHYNSPFHNYNNADYHNNSPYHNHNNSPYHNHNNSPYHNYNNADYHNNSPYNSPYHNHNNSPYNDHNNSPFHNHNNADYHNNSLFHWNPL